MVYGRLEGALREACGAVIELAGRRPYQSGAFPFALFTPELGTKVDHVRVLGDVLRAAQAPDDLRRSPVQWKLLGMLENPWRRYISKKSSICVRTH